MKFIRTYNLSINSIGMNWSLIKLMIQIYETKQHQNKNITLKSFQTK